MQTEQAESLAKIYPKFKVIPITRFCHFISEASYPYGTINYIYCTYRLLVGEHNKAPRIQPIQLVVFNK